MLAGALGVGGVSLQLDGSETTVPDAAEAVAEDEPGLLELFVAPEKPVLTDGDTEVRFAVLLRNSGETTAPEGSVELALGGRLTGDSARQPAGSDAPATTTPSEKPAGEAEDPRTVIATVSIDSVAAGKEQSATVAVPLSDIPEFTTATHGVYPLYANYVASDAPGADGLSAFSPLVWGGPGGSDAAVDLTSIVPLTLPASVQSMPSRAQLNDAAPRLSALVDFATASQSILAIDPRIITAIRGYGTEAPRAASELLTRLESTTLPSFLLQFGDADPAAQAALGLDALLEPSGFEFVTRFGAWEPQRPEPNPADDARETGSGSEAGTVSDPDPKTDPKSDPKSDAEPKSEPETDPDPKSDPADAPETDPGEDETPPPPTAEELTDWPNGLAGSWPAAGQVSSRTLAMLRGAGLDLTVLNSENVRLTGGPRAALGESSALVTDAELDAAVRLALTGSTDTERALGESQAAARLALAASSGVDGLILGIDRAGITEAERPEELLALLTDERWIRPVAYGAQREGTAQLLPGAAGEERVELLAEALGNENTVLEARALLVNPEYLDSYQRMRLLTLFGTRNAQADADFAAVARQFAKRDGELHDGVKLVDTKRAQLVGGSTRIPIQLRNSLPFDAAVTLDVAPTSAALVLPERTFASIPLPEDSSERVLVPAKSRVSSGESAMLLTVTSVDGEYTASTGRLELAISTTVETVAIAILGTAAALLFGFGAWRSVRRRRSLSPRE